MAVSWDSNSISTLFSSLSSSGTGFFGTGSASSSNLLADYYSIKNGSYGKLMKSYYNQLNESTASSTSKSSSTDKTASTNTTKATVAKDVKSAADTLKTSANAMLDSKLYAKVTSTDEDGNKTEAVDTDKVFKAASDFVDSYNKMLKSGAKSDSSMVKSNISSMTSNTTVNSKALANIGITINEDKSLSIDEEKFKNANMNDVQSLFGSRGGYGYQIAALATSASFAASNSFTSGYTSTGSYTYSGASSYYDAV